MSAHTIIGNIRAAEQHIREAEALYGHLLPRANKTILLSASLDLANARLRLAEVQMQELEC
jgi:hypothetical protein